MLAALDLNPRVQALDVAAGTGILSTLVAPHVQRVIALDATPAMIRQGIQARGHAGLGNLAFLLGLAEALPVLTNAFDRVVCRFALHHFPDPARAVLRWHGPAPWEARLF